MATEKRTVDEYAPRIIANWNQRAQGRDRQPAFQPINGNLILERQVLSEDLIRAELAKVREVFIQEAKKLEVQRIVDIEVKVRKEYDLKLGEKASELDRARRIINIQNAIISRLFEEDKKILLKVLKDAEISEDDLRILADTGVQE